MQKKLLADLTRWKQHPGISNISYNTFGMDKNNLQKFRDNIEKSISKDINDNLSSQKLAKLHMVQNLTKIWCDNWVEKGLRLLEECSKNGNKCVIVTAARLLPALSKLYMFRTNKFVDPKDVYSTRGGMKIDAFRAIMKNHRFKGWNFCAIGDGKEEMLTSMLLRIPFFKIEGTKDLDECTKIISLIPKKRSFFTKNAINL